MKAWGIILWPVNGCLYNGRGETADCDEQVLVIWKESHSHLITGFCHFSVIFTTTVSQADLKHKMGHLFRAEVFCCYSCLSTFLPPFPSLFCSSVMPELGAGLPGTFLWYVNVVILMTMSMKFECVFLSKVSWRKAWSELCLPFSHQTFYHNHPNRPGIIFTIIGIISQKKIYWGLGKVF